MQPRKFSFFKYLLIVLLWLITTAAFAQRGCCSWHGGVASCDAKNSRLICRDGTYSPSCGC